VAQQCFPCQHPATLKGIRLIAAPGGLDHRQKFRQILVVAAAAAAAGAVFDLVLLLRQSMILTADGVCGDHDEEDEDRRWPTSRSLPLSDHSEA